jgi:predicted nucleic acid-binding protein
MNLVLDTNVLLSALIKDSTTRMIIAKSEWSFYYPEISFCEIRKYKSVVLKKSGMSQQDYVKLLAYLVKRIVLVPDEQVNKNLEAAKKIMAHIDPDDVVFVAAKLSIPNSIIWSDDKDFDKQSKVEVLKSEQVARLFFLKKLDK